MTTSGHIILAGITMLANPRAAEPSRGPRNMLFDANFPVLDDGRKPCIGLLRYFLPDSIDSATLRADTFTQAFIVANIVNFPAQETPEILHNVLTPDVKYAFYGEINLFLLTEDVNRHMRPYISIAGVVSQINRNGMSFNMRPTQYMPHLHSTFEFSTHAYFKDDNKKWARAKKIPMPNMHAIVCVGGFLEEVTRNPSKKVTAFEVDISTISYIGNFNQSQLAAPSTSHTVKSITVADSTHFNYDADDDAKLDSKAPKSRKGKGKQRDSPEEVEDDEQDNNDEKDEEIEENKKDKERHTASENDDDEKPPQKRTKVEDNGEN